MVEERWLPLAEAAQVLGLSIDAARRKVRSGILAAEKRETPQGGTWWVRLAGGDELPPTTSRLAPPGATSPAAPNPDLSALVGLVERLQAQVIERTEAATLWQVRADVLSVQLEQARSSPRALKAPAPHAPETCTAANLTAQVDEPTTGPFEPLSPPIPPGPNGPGWWRRAQAWLMA